MRLSILASVPVLKSHGVNVDEPKWVPAHKVSCIRIFKRNFELKKPKSFIMSNKHACPLFQRKTLSIAQRHLLYKSLEKK